MKRAIIKKDGIETNRAEMPELELNAWIEKHKAMKSFGVNDEFEMQPNLLQAEVVDLEGNIISPAVYEMEEYEIEPGVMSERKKLYEVQTSFANYTIEISDITEEVNDAQAIEDALKEIQKGMKALAVFKARVKAKGLTQLQILELFSDAAIAQIISALTTGSLPASVMLVSAYEADGVLVSEEDKASVIAALS